jgi:hypothetical protein
MKASKLVGLIAGLTLTTAAAIGCGGSSTAETAVTTAPAKNPTERAADGPITEVLAVVNAPMEKAADAERAQRAHDEATAHEQGR